MATIPGNIPINLAEGESSKEYDLFLFFSSLPQCDRSIKKSFELYKLAYPNSRLTLSKWSSLANIFNWIDRADKFDSYLLAEGFKKIISPKVDLMRELLKYRDSFKDALKDNFEQRKLLAQNVKMMVQQFSQDGDDEAFSVRCNNLYKLAQSFVQIHGTYKQDFEMWGSLLGIQDIAERQSNAVFNDISK